MLKCLFVSLCLCFFCFYPCVYVFLSFVPFFCLNWIFHSKKQKKRNWQKMAADKFLTFFLFFHNFDSSPGIINSCDRKTIHRYQYSL
jgi:hypothetical protein